MKSLIITDEFRTSGVVRDAVCNGEIYCDWKQKDIQVVISDPSEENYNGRSVTNNFERFATVIRNKYLKEYPATSIRWVELQKWKMKGCEDLLLDVKLKWDGKEYHDAEWFDRDDRNESIYFDKFKGKEERSL